jgi:predicted HAD superfamily Cof-like phosphohydrolase
VSLVRRFHIAFGQPAPNAPTIPDAASAALRVRLITEEYKEVKVESDRLLAALRANAPADVIVDILQRLVKEVCDLRYVSEGTLVAFGVEPEAYEEVHRSNMSKLGPGGKPIRREDGKALKGPNYAPADPDKMFPSIIDVESHEEE